ncbi:putative 2-aminoethylphosphonate ABC transporter ATP-binding protein [Pandoraea anhela]|uniref:Amino acid ABC transporter substrate-binding protein n=1 Tax=Pandoraea anhela TaxID=2508295 RepID=A0A5E4XNB3_9BURK|nr:putative 2-aminoethylphosphonate ABC transporter ATP-binding protein [Pandoraea anhela]VVE37723.1 amino acid ABC transporter substrate-binding protein [Pandoraea anhela]
MSDDPRQSTYLTLAGIHKRFDATVVLHDIHLTVRRGEMLCFLGPSGCGKTTLLRIIAGLEAQTQGTLSQNGRDISRLPPMQRDYGIVFQSYALFPNLSVAQNVAYGLTNRRVPRAERDARVAELLTMVGLPDAGEKFPGQLSGGQQQRIAIARALATSPGLLLLDEPLSALDARVRVRLRSEIRALQQRLGITTILVTHDQEEALSMADRIVVMNQGVIEQVGTPGEIYQHPATPFVADFVGKTNILPARLGDAGRVRVGHYELTCGTLNGCRAGEDIRVFFRPEDVRVRDLHDLDDDANLFDGAVEKIEFLGAFSRVTLRMPACDHPLYADLSPADMQALQPATGGALRFAVPSAAVRVFRQG